MHPYIPGGSHAAIVFIVPIVRGLWLPAKEGSKLFTNLKNMDYILSYNMKKGTKGDTKLMWLKSWNPEHYVHIQFITAEHSRKTIALPKHKLLNFYVQISYLY